MKTKRLLALLLFCGAVLAAAPRPEGVLRVVFVDQSDSPQASDAARWSQAAESAVFSPMRFGDAVIVFGVHDHTAESAPLFEAAIPVCAPDAGMDVVLAARKALRQAREGGVATIRAAFAAPVRSRSTRLVESFRRIPRDGRRAIEVLYLSDMLESTRELDLEHTAITDGNLTRLAQRAVDQYRLPHGMLDGVTFRVVLDSPAVGSRRVMANDHGALERFWRLLITSLGGAVVGFDSRIH
jgi:hypothetical protein